MKETQVILKPRTFFISSLDKLTYGKTIFVSFTRCSIKAKPQRKGNVMPHTVACNISNACSLLLIVSNTQTYGKQSLFPLPGDSIKARPQRKGNVMPHTASCNDSNACSLPLIVAKSTFICRAILSSAGDWYC